MLFLFSFWQPSNANFGMLGVVPEAAYTTLFFFFCILCSCCFSWLIFAFLCSKSLVPFKLLTWYCSSEGLSSSNSVYGFCKRNYLGNQKFLPLTQSSLVFTARGYGDLSSWHWNPGLGVPGVGLGLFAPKSPRVLVSLVS